MTPSNPLQADPAKPAIVPAPCILDLATINFPDVPLVDLFPELPLKQTLALLGRVGLGEVWTYLRTPAELSDGQRWRLKLAAGVYASGALAPDVRPEDASAPDASAQNKSVPDGTSQDESAPNAPAPDGPAQDAPAPCVLVCDEFTAVLDRVTAGVVARGLRKLIDVHADRLSAVLATAHDDLQDALRPDTTVHADFTRVHVCHARQ